jgi:hypothetical protein
MGGGGGGEVNTTLRTVPISNWKIINKEKGKMLYL